MKRRLLVLLLAWLAGSPAFATTPHDLGEGLTYWRLATLPADLPSGGQPGACVLDLRYAAGNEAAAIALAGWLKFHAAARTPVLVLANPATATPLLQALASTALPGGTLTLGRPGPGFTPDLAIATTAETEQLAYDAFTAGTTLAALMQENPGKERHDEAAIVRQLADGTPPPAAEPDPAATSTEPLPPPPLIDRTLQRAVQVHRGLVALQVVRP